MSRCHQLLLVGTRDTRLILPYTAANDRQLHRAIDRLERLQRRKGEGDPPPGDVDV